MRFTRVYNKAMYFEYGREALEYLSKDAKMKAVIESIGEIHREVDTDLFSSVIHHIVGQQISTKAQATIYQRLHDLLGVINVDTVLECDDERLQSVGLTYRKVSYIKDFCEKVKTKEIVLDDLYKMDDAEVIQVLSSLKGIGRWTAEMILLFCMQRQDIFSYDDLGIQRGLRMIYHHRKITRPLFEKYRRRFSPYGSVASLYIWEVSKGAIDGMKDYGK